nr:CBO2463/CBO2479 domain-containing protein [Dethiosulfovibrio faecalis]
MNYGDKLIVMAGVIVDIQDGAVGMDLKGRLGSLRVPKRMLICDEPLQIGQEVAFRMSFPEVVNSTPNEKYVQILEHEKERNG